MRAISPARLPDATLVGSNPTRTTTPMKPTARPASRLYVIRSSCRNTAAMRITNSGTAALRIAARAESTVSSAHVIKENGIAMLTAPMTMRWP